VLRIVLLLLTVGIAAMGKGGRGGHDRRRGGGRRHEHEPLPDLESIHMRVRDDLDHAESGDPGSSADDDWNPAPAPANGGNGWDSDEAARAAHGGFTNLGDLLPSREQHILHGDLDDETSGGHLHGTGRPGKTEFPEGWDEDRVVDNVQQAARHPDRVVPRPGNAGGWEAHARVDGVDITVILNKDGSIWSAYPTGGDGVHTNPM
jgi:hypothetical protein